MTVEAIKKAITNLPDKEQQVLSVWYNRLHDKNGDKNGQQTKRENKLISPDDPIWDLGKAPVDINGTTGAIDKQAQKAGFEIEEKEVRLQQKRSDDPIFELGKNPIMDDDRTDVTINHDKYIYGE